jgi:mono/diheme cytochrome c family protein
MHQFAPTSPAEPRAAAHHLRHHRSRALAAIGACVIGLVASAAARAHGDVTPQAVDTSSLPKLGVDWRDENPFRANEAAVKIGASAFNQNCARCHGLEAISGGIAPICASSTTTAPPRKTQRDARPA